jgi:hypothetical protein
MVVEGVRVIPVTLETVHLEVELEATVLVRQEQPFMVHKDLRERKEELLVAVVVEGLVVLDKTH